MDIKQKIRKLKQRSVELATLALTLFPMQSGLSASNQKHDAEQDKKIPSSSQVLMQSYADVLDDGVTMNIGEFKEILQKNPDIEFSSDMLAQIQPGPSQKKIHDLLSKGFSYIVTNSYGVKKRVKCSLNQAPKGYCYGAVKHLLNKVYNLPKSNNLSAYQEKDNLLKSDAFIGIPIELSEVEKCPINTVVVIPACRGHRHGHIFTVVDKGVYCSDGKETAGDYFDKNYKDAKGIYAFIPVDGSIKLTPELLQKSPQLFAAVLSYQTGEDIQPASPQKAGSPILLAQTVQNKGLER